MGADEVLHKYVVDMNTVKLRNPGKWQRLLWVRFKEMAKPLLGTSINGDSIYRNY